MSMNMTHLGTIQAHLKSIYLSVLPVWVGYMLLSP